MRPPGARKSAGRGGDGHPRFAGAGSGYDCHFERRVLEKPRDAEHAAAMLRLLSGHTHQVMTAVALADKQQTLDCLVVTEVTFRRLSEQDIADYVASGEPLDKAGAYGIQGLGGCFVRKINGSYHAVVGLPLVETYELLSNFNSLRKGKG
mgnify:CR=1 FL=1